MLKISLKHLLPIFLILFFISCRQQEIEVQPTADFSYEIADSDYSIPVKIVFTNKSKAAQTFKWTFEGGTPETYDKKDPGYVLFNKPGNIKVKLEIWNGTDHNEKEITILLDSVVKADFEIAPVINNFGPTQFSINNKSQGATKFNWTFSGGTPSTSIERSPSVNYATPGNYMVQLEVKNDRGEKNTISKSITVLPALSTSGFDIEPSFADDDYEAPFTAVLRNHTTNATVHQWASPGGVISNNADSIPTIRFDDPGTYQISYVASNGKQKDSITKTVTIKPNTGLRTFTNVKLGINTAHSTIGSFFSTSLHKVLKKEEVTMATGPKIDLVFFGLSESFSYNLFVSPDSAGKWTFGAVPAASSSTFMNIQNNFTSSDFDQVTNGQALGVLNIIQGNQTFDNSQVPRVVLFQNASGSKGAIRIKQFVLDGQQSYIVCDIKVQKTNSE